MADMDWTGPESSRFRRGFGSPERVRWLRTFPCAACGGFPTEAAHVKSRASGGGPDDMIPLCAPCHIEQHTVGVVTFAEIHGLDLRALAGEYAARWQRYSRSPTG